MRYAIDMSVPENRFPTDTGIARSLAVEHWIERFFDADAEGDADGRRAALRAVIGSNRADHAAAGLPVYAHAPLPEDFVDEIIAAIEGLPEHVQQRAVGTFAADVDQDARPMVMQQLSTQVADRGRSNQPSAPLDPDSPEARRRGDARDAEDPLAAAAHPWAYGGDAAMDDLFGKEGLFGDWGWRRTVPAPSGALPRVVGEGARFYLGSGPFAIGRVGRLGRGAGAAAKEGAAARSSTRAAGSRVEKTMARTHYCDASCHCYPVRAGADCPPFVRGAGSGPSQQAACLAAKNSANASVPDGCQKRHCKCNCR